MNKQDIIRFAVITAIFVMCGFGAYQGQLSWVAALATALASLTGVGLLAPTKEKTVVVASGDDGG